MPTLGKTPREAREYYGLGEFAGTVSSGALDVTTAALEVAPPLSETATYGLLKAIQASPTVTPTMVVQATVAVAEFWARTL